MVTIAHAAAFTADDQVPLAHAVALAARSGARVVSVHADDGSGDAAGGPDVDALVARWGAGRAVAHESMLHTCEDPVGTTIDALSRLGPDLVVAGTHQREGIRKLLFGSRAESIARNLDVPTLLIPVGSEGFVSRYDGSVDLRRVLIPIGDAPAANAGLAAARWLTELAEAQAVTATLLHVGSPHSEPDIELPSIDGWTFEVRMALGSLEDAIVEQADHACVVVMATRGEDSIGDVLAGSHTERVLHRVKCPLLSVPIRKS